MPYIGVGFHILVALFFAVHAVRNGREMYWLMILFMFPLLGSVVYFFAVYLPETKLERGMRKTVTAAAKTLDRGRDVREAKKAYDLVPTAQNQTRLAEAYLDAGDTAQAVQHYDLCLQGPFARDAEIRMNAAYAKILHGQSTDAIALLEAVRKEQPNHRPEQQALLLGQAYVSAGRQQEAGVIFADAVARFGSMETRVEYAIWALQAGEQSIADSLYAEIQQTMKHWSRDTKSLNSDLVKRLNNAFSSRN
ncbi:tetratricopeptide repeat protein [Undibacterium sp. CY18W]|uniref:Tetratricopeptide repeat protein n=2 Tax=Undibacterium hunanense TaxID=2762292 RepID=A0ABR6ZPV7_9BURK|nr:tetratricopeptide repeat protein [Undibacterium hunanense]